MLPYIGLWMLEVFHNILTILFLTCLFFFLAVLEWVIAFGFALYLLTLSYDLRMSKGIQKGELSRDRLTEMGQTIPELRW